MTTGNEHVTTAGIDRAGTAAERNIMAFRRFVEEGLDGGDAAVVDELFTPDFQEHQNGVMPPTVEGVKTLIRQLHEGLENFHCTIVDIAAVGDKVWARLEGSGTHTRVFFGISPTGRAVSIDIMDLCRFEDGKVAEHWGVPDNLSLLRQLGALSEPAGGKRR